jgi:pimeloyl-ACP methyl ester carboxylesterase
MCGDPQGAEPWIDLATQRGTFIVVRANVPCPDRPGYKWPKEVEAIQERIDAALSLVKDERGGLLNTDVITLIGYSQGAHRAERLAQAYPSRYPKLVLGGPPTPPEVASFPAKPRIAILGGELENTDHMQQGYHDLLDGGLSARFFVLPRTHHGGYGPEGRRVMSEVFEWLDGQR